MGLVTLVAVLMGQDIVSKGDACRCAASLALNHAMHEVSNHCHSLRSPILPLLLPSQLLVKEGAVAPLVACLDLEDRNCQRYSALALANMLSAIKTQVSDCTLLVNIDWRLNPFLLSLLLSVTAAVRSGEVCPSRPCEPLRRCQRAHRGQAIRSIGAFKYDNTLNSLPLLTNICVVFFRSVRYARQPCESYRGARGDRRPGSTRDFRRDVTVLLELPYMQPFDLTGQPYRAGRWRSVRRSGASE